MCFIPPIPFPKKDPRLAKRLQERLERDRQTRESLTPRNTTFL